MSTSIRDALAQFELDNRSRRLSPHTLKHHRFHLGRFAAWCEANDANTVGAITAPLIRACLVAMQARNLSPHTVHGTARVIKRFLNFCVGEELIGQSPMRRVAMPRIPKTILPAFSEADVRRLLDACLTERDRAAILVLLDTGLRASEFVALNGQDVDLAIGTVKVRHGKGGKDRVTYLGHQSREALGRYLQQADGPLWRNPRDGRRLTDSGLRQLLERIGRRAAVAECHPHRFRRTFALWSLRAGMSIYHLQRLMGHEDITVLRQYLALVESDLQAAHERYGAVDVVLSEREER